MGRKPKSDAEIAAAALEKARKLKAEEMRVRRAYSSLYGAVPPKHKHKKIISLDRIANPPPPRRTCGQARAQAEAPDCACGQEAPRRQASSQLRRVAKRV